MEDDFEQPSRGRRVSLWTQVQRKLIQLRYAPPREQLKYLLLFLLLSSLVILYLSLSFTAAPPSATSSSHTPPGTAVVLEGGHALTFRYDNARTGVAPPSTTSGYTVTLRERMKRKGWSLLPTFDLFAPSNAPNGAAGGPGGELTLYTKDWETPRLNYDTYSASKSSPAVVGDVIYIGTDRGTLLAASRATGEVLWEYQCKHHTKGIHGTPTVDGDMVYIGGYDGHMYGIDRHDGELVWVNKVGGSIGASSLVFKDTLLIGVEVFRGQSGGWLIGLDKNTGIENFRSQLLDDFCHSSPAFDEETGLAFMGDNSGLLSCWNVTAHLQSGDTRNPQTNFWDRTIQAPREWEFKSLNNYGRGKHGDIKSTPMVYRDLVYFTSWDRNIYALNKFTGKMEWHYKTKGSIMSSPAIDPTRNLVVVGSSDQSIYCLDARTGALRWSIPTDGGIMSSATILPHEGVAIIGSGTSRNDWSASGGGRGIWVVDIETGQVLQTLALRSGLTGMPVAVRSNLYAFDHLGYLYSFSSRIV
ncbi:Quinate/shikimate dehydrogenase (Quinone) [Balamuthia mandrillaris]